MTARWNVADMARLKALHVQGLTAAEIGTALGRSKPAVISAVKRLRRRGAALERRGGETQPQESPALVGKRAAFGCRAHLRDLKASGGGWASYAIPAERSCPYRAGPAVQSLNGSPAALCIDA